MIRALVFDFDGVLVESVDTKTKAYAALFKDEGEEVIRSVLKYHLENGGVSRFEKFRFIYQRILCQPLSKEKFHSLCENFSKMIFAQNYIKRYLR